MNLTNVVDVELLIPTVHPHVCEPVTSADGFALELWTDWSIPKSEVTSYERAAVGMTSTDYADGLNAIRGVVVVVRDVLWLSVVASGPGSVDDRIWTRVDRRFRNLWSAVHERAHTHE